MSIAGNPNAYVKKTTIIETTTPLPAGGTFTGAWHDSQEDGTMFVTATAFSNQASGANGFTIQESDDNTNVNFTRNVQSATTAVNALFRMFGVPIRARFWRIIYTNGATAVSSLEVTTCAFSVLTLSIPGDIALAANIVGSVVGVYLPEANLIVPDNVSVTGLVVNQAGSSVPLVVDSMAFGGAFSGTPNVALQNWSRVRTPTVFKQATASAAGNTAVWTPGANNKFRLLRFKIHITANASLAVAGILTVTFQDNVTGLPLGQSFWIPAAAATTQQSAYETSPIDLGSFGILSAVANNVLNINLSVALVTGQVNVIVAGVEE